MPIQHQFDLRIRALDDDGKFRCVLLPHLLDDGADRPWARAIGEQSPAPGAPIGTDHGALWLPPAGTKLRFLAAPGAQLGSRIHRLRLEGDDPTDLNPIFANGHDEPEVVCFAGLGALLNQPDGTDSVAAARSAKEFLLYLIEAFRFDGDLEDFARIGNPEMLACLSHLVFELHTEGNAEKNKVLDADEWMKGRVKVVYEPAAPAGETPHPTVAHEAEVPIAVHMPSPTAQPKEPDLIPIQAVQRADGVYFRLLDPKKFYVGDRPDEECKILLHRCEGDIPLETPPVVASSYFGFEKIVLDPKIKPGPGEAVEGDRKEQPITDRTFHVIDQFGAETFVGRQLHYRLDLIDGFGIVKATSSLTLLRQRFDPPPLPSKAEARLETKRGAGDAATLVLYAEYPNASVTEMALPIEGASAEAWRKSLVDEFDFEVFFQERPLDECGFYGDDDDFALMEGLRQIDALYDPKAARDNRSPIPGHPMEEHLRGRHDHAGLTRAMPPKPDALVWKGRREEPKKSDLPGTKPKEFACVTIQWPLSLGKLEWLRQLRGYQFHVGLRRRRSGATNVRAPLSQCIHVLRFDPAEEGVPEIDNHEVKIDVFQLEFFPFDVAANAGLDRRFLRRDCFQPLLLRRTVAPEEPGGRGFEPVPDVTLLRGEKDEPVVVEVDFTHPAAGSPDSRGVVVKADGDIVDSATLPVGGVRILVRDRVAEKEAAPFVVAETVQVLPRIVALYRPIQIEAGLKLTPLPDTSAAPKVSALAAPKSVEGAALENSEELTRCFGPRGVADRLRRELKARVQKIAESGVFRERGFDGSAWESSESDTESIAGVFDAQQAEIDALIANRDALPAGEARDAASAEIKDQQDSLTKAIAERAQPWLAKARKALEIDLTEINAQVSPDGAAADWKFQTPFALTWWPALGALLGLMRELGLVQDLVVQLGHIDKATDEVKALAENFEDGTPWKVIHVETADGDGMATVRIAVLPWGTRPETAAAPPLPTLSARESLLQLILGEKSRWLPLYEHIAVGPRLLRYRDATRAPLNLTLHAGRLVRYRWHGLRDQWHHDLEFAVQLLDRYERIRERYLLGRVRETGAAAGVALNENAAQLARRLDVEKEAAARRKRHFEVQDREIALSERTIEHAVRALVVPRLEPIGDPPAIFPALHRDPWLLAFEILDTEERQKAAHNTLARTRSGHLQIHLALRSDFPGASAFYQSTAAETAQEGAIRYLQELADAGNMPLFEWWRDRLAAAGELLIDEPRYHLPPADDPRLAERVTQWPFLKWDTTGETMITATRSAPPRPACDVAAYPDEPYYLRYTQSGFYSADHLTSAAVAAEAEREPWRLALPFLPDYEIREGSGEIEILLSPALLGSHLSSEEVERALGLKSWRVDAADAPRGLLLEQFGTPAPAERDWTLPLALLPDVWMEYTFYLNLGEGAEEKLVPLFEWKAPRRNGDLGALSDAVDKPLGFVPNVLSPGLALEPVAAQWLLEGPGPGAAVVVFTVKLAPGNETLTTMLAKKPKHRLRLQLRRRSLSTDFLSLWLRKPS